MARYLGIDLGGTNVKYAIVEAADPPRVVATGSTPTQAAEGPAAVVERMLELGRQAIREHGEVDAAGAGVPGVIDVERGRALFLPNLPGPWAETPLVERLASGLGMDVALLNDARAFTLGELRLGSAQGCDDVLGIAIGTGIGGGVAIDGRLHLGLGGSAGEFGHQTVDPGGPRCPCGNRGCVETLAAGPAIAREGGRATPELVAEAAQQGDARAREVLAHAGTLIGVAVANAIVLLAPQRVVIGGGVSAAGDLLLDPIREEIRRRVFVVPIDRLEVVQAKLTPFGGAVGAAFWGAESRPPR